MTPEQRDKLIDLVSDLNSAAFRAGARFDTDGYEAVQRAQSDALVAVLDYSRTLVSGGAA